MAAQDTTTTTTGVNRNRCCFNYFPCFGPTPQLPSSSTSSSAAAASLWESSDNNKWWSRPVQALKKIREWSEIVAGPKWKTFIRRFNRKPRHHHHHHHHGHVSTGKFNYDPLSYALNFDEGHQGQNCHFDDEWVHSAPSAASVKLAVVV